ncbi:MAG: 1-phosphofructokinase family hexose kinase [Saprospiraceae bacterium]|nr:1-phosphofructokinase family hexose kinase [Saprospiraceae bacterium]
MSRIVTITFSPCIDKSTSVDALIPEKKLKCDKPKLEPGGGGINVARAIKKLGGEATAVYPSGGYTGKHFNYLLDKEAISSLIVETKEETRENFIVLDDSNKNQYRFGMPGTALSEEEWQMLLEKIDEIPEVAFIVASGSLPPGVPNDIFARLAKIAKSKNAKLIVDTSGEPLKEALEEGLFLLKPNLGELSFLADKPNLLESDVMEIATSLCQQGNCEIIVVSMGPMGAWIISKTEAHLITPPQVEKLSTVGAGDSMVAGIVYYFSLGKSMLDAGKFGVACGTAATMNEGTELCNLPDVLKLYNQLTVKSM